MRILLLGNTGQLGYEAERALSCLGDVTALDYPVLDFAHPETLPALVEQAAPDIIYNAVAYTAVDKAESEPEKARLINAVAPGVLAEAARRRGAVLVHISSDYVFDGAKSAPYVEEDATHPLNLYGQTKLDGDLAVQQAGGAYFIFRPAWVFSSRRDSFLTKVLQWARKNATLQVVDDQVSNPTWARALAEISALVLARGGEDLFSWASSRSGVYHLAGDGSASRYEWARTILACDPNPEEQVVKELIPVKSDAFPTPALRPLANALNCDKFQRTFNLRLPPWQSAVKWALQK